MPDGREAPLRTKGLVNRYPPSPFGASSVGAVLLRRFYTGELPYYVKDDQGRKRKRENYVYTAPGRHPTLVSKERFEQALQPRQLSKY